MNWWTSTVRHWWRYEPAERAMIHRASGEKVIFRGQTSVENGAGPPVADWARFDYEYERESYPLLIEVRRVRYPNTMPDRYVRAPYNGVSEPYSNLLVWRLDHIRSGALWARESTSQVPYALWRRADRAMIDAALLWPREYGVLPPPDEVAVNGGWLNGSWTPDFYRRLYPRDPELYRDLSYGRPMDCRIMLPLQDYTTKLALSASPVWESSIERSIGMHGERLEEPTCLIRNTLDGTTISKAGDIPMLYAPDRRNSCIVARRDNLYVGLLMTSSNELNLLEGWPGDSSSGVCASWNISVYGSCAMGLVDAGDGFPSFLGKMPVSRDSITDPRQRKFHYSESTVDHPLLSYDLWQWVYEVFTSSLLFSKGFGRTPGSATQGEVGRLYFDGGFIGGLHLLATEVRRFRELPGDKGQGTSWSAFFD